MLLPPVGDTLTLLFGASTTLFTARTKFGTLVDLQVWPGPVAVLIRGNTVPLRKRLVAQS